MLILEFKLKNFKTFVKIRRRNKLLRRIKNYLSFNQLLTISTLISSLQPSFFVDKYTAKTK